MTGRVREKRTELDMDRSRANSVEWRSKKPQPCVICGETPPWPTKDGLCSIRCYEEQKTRQAL